MTHDARSAYLVLGMHRSGTSAVTQLLALAGADLPQNVMPGDEHNEKGYFEPWKLALLNDERLHAGGGAWHDPFAFPYRSLGASDDAAWVARGAAVFAEEYGQAAIPLLKDPRVSVLLPMWRDVLAACGVQPRCVIPVRHPLAVAGSLKRRDGFATEKSVLLWTAYMLASEAYSRDLPRAVVGYDALLADWRREAARIAAAHDAPLPRLTPEAGQAIDSFLTPDLRHNAAQGGLAALGWVGALAAEVLAWFEAAARDERPDPDRLEAAGAELAQRGREVGILVSPATRDVDVLRAELAAAQARLSHLEGEYAGERATLEEGWRADVEQLTGQLKAEAAAIKAGWEADVKTLTEQLGEETAARQAELAVIAAAEAELDRALSGK